VRGSQQLEWKNGTRLRVPNPEYVVEGIIPVGFDWVMNPIPVISGAHPECRNTTNESAVDSRGIACRQFDPPCQDDVGWGTTPGATDPSDVMGKCSNNWIDGLVVDEVVIPADITPGDYVLGFRWDAEQTSQVWNSCADIAITP